MIGDNHAGGENDGSHGNRFYAAGPRGLAQRARDLRPREASGPKDATYGLIVEKKGRIVADFYAVPGTDALALLVPADLRDGLIGDPLDRYLIMEDVELTAEDLTLFVAQGNAGLDAPFTGAMDVLGQPGAAYAVPAGDSDAFASKSSSSTRRPGRRDGIEHGLPRFGVEVDATLYPQEASLEKIAVSFDKGCYLGQEVVYMLENRGHVKRKLVPLDVDGDAPLAKGDAVTTPDGAAVGDVKSPCSARRAAGRDRDGEVGAEQAWHRAPGGERVARVR